jgi:hypothetical protein
VEIQATMVRLVMEKGKVMLPPIFLAAHSLKGKRHTGKVLGKNLFEVSTFVVLRVHCALVMISGGTGDVPLSTGPGAVFFPAACAVLCFILVCMYACVP